MDLEKALSRILDLEQANKEMNDQCESLKVENESFKAKMEEQQNQIASLKQMNMRYFERLTLESKPIEVATPSDSISKEPVHEDWHDFMSQW